MESDAEILQILELTDKDIKVAIVTVLMNAKEKMFIITKQIGNWKPGKLKGIWNKSEGCGAFP